ncbi:hypothetical protein CPC08DRAFT_667974 [Agrocybe pediades]|nr:hypothetical protein CPC08DRAFT_667974 [Agrocybe pediades]
MVAFAAYNGALTGASFFACREYVVSPTLVRFAPWKQYARRRHELGMDAASENALPPRSLRDLRTNKLLDNGTSGALVAGILRAVRSGGQGVIPGMLVAGTACTILQYGYNEMSIARLKYLSKQREDISLPTVEQTGPSKPWSERLLALVGVRVLSDEEYLEKMKKKRDAYLLQIADLERKREERTLDEGNKS